MEAGRAGGNWIDLWEASPTPISRDLRERLEVRRLIRIGDPSRKFIELQQPIGPDQLRALLDKPAVVPQTLAVTKVLRHSVGGAHPTREILPVRLNRFDGTLCHAGT